jgi:putative phage-type endonuclease
MDMQIGEWSKSLDALRAINAEWANDIDLHCEYLSNLFEQFGHEDMLLTIEDMMHHLDAYICENPLAFSAPDFHESVRDVLHEYFEGTQAFEFSATMDLEADALCRFCEALYFKYANPARECGSTFIRKPPNVPVIDAKLAHIRAKPQPDQRTDEWYKFRHNLLTASNAWKAFESQACINQLIYEKCKPLRVHEEPEYVNTSSTLHWGNKYEPVSRMVYEHLYKTKVADFGCLQHDKHPFLGASPDGINVDPGSQRYGRMLEIKNIVNRDITGIPKKEYWIQMQLQMETADLNECDFLETQFSEEGDNGNDNDNNDMMSNALMTGTMIYFMKDGRPHYEYEPIGFNRGESEAWFNDAMERNQAHMWMKTIHWRLEKMSCVLVLRNKLWFQHAIQVLDDLWKTIIKERNNPQGYEHRAPKRRIAASPPTNATNATATSKSASFMQAWLTSQPASDKGAANTNSNASVERKCLIDVSALE